MKPIKVALIGSSGGGAATLGHTDPSQLLQIIQNELMKIDQGEVVLSHALFVSLHGGSGLDTADASRDLATLYAIQETLHDEHPQASDSSLIHVQIVKTATLTKVNEKCREMDGSLAESICRGQIRGLICISCNVEIHAETLKAAANVQIPVTGSGGTSLSAAVAQFGIRLVGNAGGSVANTSHTRAVSYTHALASAWKLKYHFFTRNLQIHHPQWKSVLNSCLPAFWAVCLTLRLLRFSRVSHLWGSIFTADLTEFSNMLETMALPTVCCIVMATSCAPHHGSTAAVAASIAAMACGRSVLAGLLAGWIVALTLGPVLYQCIMLRVPATMTNLVVAGAVGVGVAFIVSPLLPALRMLSVWTRKGVFMSMEGTFPGQGFIVGCLFCYGSKIGYYHALFLPLILLEMENGDASIWGAVDECTLVLVSAGICSANLFSLPSHDKSGRELCWRAVTINLLCGDFIEAAYPYMNQHLIINIFGYIASGLSVEILSGRPKEFLSSAYLPLPASIWLSNDRKRMALACFTAFGVSFVGTLLSNALVRFRRIKES